MNTFAFSTPSKSLIFCIALLGASCSKSENAESNIATDKNSPVAAAAEGSEKAKGDLEAAIAAPGAKKVTALGANGETLVAVVNEATLADTETYTVTANIPKDIKTGAKVMVAISLSPKPGWKINQDFPTKLSIEGPAGAELASASMGANDAKKFSEKSARFEVECTAKSAGALTFNADFRFAMCTDATCDPKKAKLAWTLDVE